MHPATMQVLTAKLLVEMGEYMYLFDNLQVIVNGFRHAGILAALDNSCGSDQEDEGDGDGVEEVSLR